MNKIPNVKTALNALREAARELAVENLIACGANPFNLEVSYPDPRVEVETTRILQELTEQTRDTAVQMYEDSLAKVAK
jgi:hypothetical protein